MTVIYDAIFECSCGNIFRVSFTEGYKTFMPRKCDKCGEINKEGFIIEEKETHGWHKR